MEYAISTLKKKARESGFSLREGYQRYHHDRWGYCLDNNGNRIKGFEIYDYHNGLVLYPHDLYSYAMTEEEARDLILKLCEIEA